MTWLNEHDVRRAAALFEGHAFLGPATQTLANLMEWTNDHSDGWPYWPKPSNAAQRLQRLIYDAVSRDRFGHEPEVELADVIKAYRPIKAFLTRQGVSPVEQRQILVDLPVVSR